MKLLTRTNQTYFLFSLVTYIVIVVVFYQLIQYLIYEEVEQRLRVEKRDFINYTLTNKSWANSDYFVENKIDWHPSKTPLVTDFFKDTLLYNKYDQSYQPFRQISFYTSISHLGYQVRIRKSLIESNKLIAYMTLVMLVLLSIALLSTFIIQRRISKKLWTPFYQTLFKIKTFELRKNTQPVFDAVSISEFNELNELLSKMTRKMLADYNNLKRFTENASHEIQTPLALINARVEELIQSKNLSEVQIYWIQEIYHASTRISKLHQGLSLLAKIENRQFIAVESVSLKTLMLLKLEEHHEIIEYKKIRIHVDLNDDFVVDINPLLADILVTNLIGNAIKHNVSPGQIYVSLSENSLSIRNTGNPLSIATELIFERFKKDKNDTDSLGLGLAIVKEICESAGLKIAYTFKHEMHHFKLTLA